MRKSRAGLKDPKRPIGSFIFAGPTGVSARRACSPSPLVVEGAARRGVRVSLHRPVEQHRHHAAAHHLVGRAAQEQPRQAAAAARLHVHQDLVPRPIELRRKRLQLIALLRKRRRIAVELLGIRSLSFAVGAYLSIGTTLAIFAGGAVRWLVDTAAKRAGDTPAESEVSPGSLFASGLIAAGGIMGLAGIGVKLFTGEKPNPLDMSGKLPAMGLNPTAMDIIAVITFLLLAASLYYFARKPLESARIDSK